jgi:phytol kinase
MIWNFYISFRDNALINPQKQYAVLYGIILLIGEGLYRILNLKPEWPRNFSHLAVGIVSLPYPWLFSSHWWVLLIAIQSSAILYVTRRYGLIPSHHQSAGKSMGSYLFYISIYLCFIVSSYLDRPHFFVFPILVLSISDVAASIIGRYFGRNPRGSLKRLFAKDKTLA